MKRPSHARRGSPKKVMAPKRKTKVSRKAFKINPNLVRVNFNSKSRFTRVFLKSLMGAVAALVVLIGATLFSPLLAVEKIKITGNHSVSTKALAKTLQSQMGKPLPQVSDSEIAKLLAPYKLIESFSLVSSPPHTLVVRIVERTAIAIVYDGGDFFYFDPAGVRLGKARNTSKLPTLDIKGTPATSETFKMAIQVILALPADLLPKIALISARSTDNISFRLRGYAGQRVIWGDKSDATLKSKVLAALIKNQSSNDRVTYDVSSPNAPTVRY